ncbi:aminotransferase class I/II-fold pyridoxal phosphate-dependent enzyme [Candidatus Falkowbacteria bacterium]|nr:aminotransferase class I/II-fold pyridoxal phosphate-dependent enzyme [Candidatus Falkowbacteria bacterium]
MKFSKRSTHLVSSSLYVFFRKVKEQEALGKKIISLGVGEPYQDTPEPIKEAGIAAIKANKTRYNTASGSMALRQALAKKYDVAPEQVALASGAKPFLGSIMWSVIDEGDIIFMAGPVYPPFFQIAESNGARVVLIDTKPNGFKMTLAALEKAYLDAELSGHAAHILLNSPNNPTGVAYDRAELEKIVSFCRERNMTIISDECYNNFSADPDFTVRQLDDQAIIINSFSKTYAMTGWRLGYAIMPQDLAVVVGRYLDNYLGCASSIADAAAMTALETEPLADFTEQRDMIHTWLDKHGIPYAPSTGGIFVFPDFAPIMAKKGIADSTGLASYFLEQAEVAATPGSAFGEAYDTHLRLSYCIRPEELRLALERLDAVI